MNWFERSQRRSADLARGVDADLVRDKRRHYRLAWMFFILSFLLAGLGSKIHFSNTLRWVFLVPGGALSNSQHTDVRVGAAGTGFPTPARSGGTSKHT
jgi:hypothetical protein